MPKSTAEKVLQFINQSSQPAMFEAVDHLVRQAFELAEADSVSRITHCNLRRRRKQSQDRFFYVQEALVGVGAGWAATNRVATKWGESYTQLETKHLLVTVHVPTRFNGNMRPAKYRDDNAETNIGIQEQLQLALDEDSEIGMQEPLDKLNILVVAIAPDADQPQNSPAQIRVLVPFANNKGYHLKVDIEALLASYSTSKKSQGDVDKAWPRLRKQLRKAEDIGNQNKQNE